MPATQRSLPRIGAMMLPRHGSVKLSADFGLAKAEKDGRVVKGGLGCRRGTGGVARPTQRRSGARRYPPPCCAEGRAIRPSRARRFQDEERGLRKLSPESSMR